MPGSYSTPEIINQVLEEAGLGAGDTLRPVLLELRRLADGDPPDPSAAVAELMNPHTAPVTGLEARRRNRHRRTIIATTAVDLSLGLGAAAAAAASPEIRDDAQKTITGIIHTLIPGSQHAPVNPVPANAPATTIPAPFTPGPATPTESAPPPVRNGMPAGPTDNPSAVPSGTTSGPGQPEPAMPTVPEHTRRCATPGSGAARQPRAGKRSCLRRLRFPRSRPSGRPRPPNVCHDRDRISRAPGGGFIGKPDVYRSATVLLNPSTSTNPCTVVIMQGLGRPLRGQQR